MRRAAMAAAAAMALSLAPRAAAWPPKVLLPVQGPSTNAPRPAADEVPPLWFAVGEQLRFKLQWGVVPVGTAHAWTEWLRENGQWRIALRLRTRSSAVLSAIYPVDDFIESVVDPHTFLPLRFVKKMNEGNNRYDEVTEFDHAAGVARWRSRLRNREKEFPIEADTRDIPSLLYWFRQRALEPGDTNTLRVMADNKIYTITPRPVVRESIRLDKFGAVRCIRFEPVAEFDGLFVRKGRVWFWVSDDDRRLAVRIDAEVPVAKVRAVLTEAIGPGGERWRGTGPAPAPPTAAQL